MALVELQEIGKTYKMSDNEIHAVRNVNCTINEGDFIVIFGKSGSGKSTLLSLIAGLESPTSGSITINGELITDKSQNALAKLRRNEVGIIFQHFYLLNALTAYENVEVPLIIAGISEKERRVRTMKLLKLVQLEERASHYPSELSGGERQRIAIARALANRAKIIIADEPTGDLDSGTGQAIIDILENLNKGLSDLEFLNWKPTIIMVTHDISVLREGMRVITLSDGNIQQDVIYSNKGKSSEGT